MSRAMDSRLAKLEENGGEDRNSPAWLAVRQWLGESLSGEEEAQVAAWDAEQPPYDPAAPVDMSGWSQEAREWFLS